MYTTRVNTMTCWNDQLHSAEKWTCYTKRTGQGKCQYTVKREWYQHTMDTYLDTEIDTVWLTTPAPDSFLLKIKQQCCVLCVRFNFCLFYFIQGPFNMFRSLLITFKTIVSFNLFLNYNVLTKCYRFIYLLKIKLYVITFKI